MIELTIDLNDINRLLKEETDAELNDKKIALIGLLKSASIDGLEVNALSDNHIDSFRHLSDNHIYSFRHQNKEYKVDLKGFCLVKSSHTKNSQEAGHNWLLMTAEEFRKSAVIRRAPAYFRVDNQSNLKIGRKKKLLKYSYSRDERLEDIEERFSNEAELLPLLKA